MEHPEVLPGGRNAKHSINNNNSNNQISKRSNIMNATKVFSRGLIALLSLLLLVGVTFGQNLVLGGSTATYGGTWNVKGNIDNTAMLVVVGFTGTVNLKGTAAQSIGVATKPEIDFGTLKATGVSTKTFNVPSAITTNIDLTTATTTQFVLNGYKLTLSGTITNTGGAGTPYDFTAAGSEVDYHGAAQTVFTTPYDKLTVSAAGGDKTLAGNVTVASALSVSAGNLAIAANTLTVNGTYSAVGTVTGGATSNITLNGTGDLASFTVTNGLQNLTVNRNTYTVTLGADLTLANALALNNGTFAVSTRTLTLNGNGTVISVAGTGSLSSAATGTVDYHANAQNVIAANYGNLTFTAGNKTLAAAGTVGIAGTFTPGPGTHTVTNSTVDFNGAAQNIPVFSFNNLLTHGAGTTKTAGGNIGIAGTFDNGGSGNDAVTLLMGAYTLTGTISDNTASTIKFSGTTNGRAVTTGTIEYNGDDATTQTITAGTYATLVLSRGSGTNPAPKQIAGDATVHTTLDMTIPATTSLTLLAGTGSTALNVDGNMYVNGAVTNNGAITVGL